MSSLNFLERRLIKLEHLVFEKSINRGEETNAYRIWKFLMDNGPSTAEQIKSIFPADKHSTINSNLRGFPNKGVITKNGDLYDANPDYEWDDVGKINRQRPNITRASLDDESIPVDDEPVEAPVRSRVRTVRGNIWGTTAAAVNAAIQNGDDVNQVNSDGLTPLGKIFSSKSSDRNEIIEVLLLNGANPNVVNKKGNSILNQAVLEDESKIVALLGEYHADPVFSGSGSLPLHTAYRQNTIINENIKWLVNDEVISKTSIFITFIASMEVRKSISSQYTKDMLDLYMPTIISHGYKNISNNIHDINIWISRELTAFGHSVVLESMLNHNIFPAVNGAAIVKHPETCNFIYNTVKNRKDQLVFLDSDNYLDVIELVCSTLHKSLKDFKDIYSVEFLKKAEDFDDILDRAVEERDIELLNKLVKTRRAAEQVGVPLSTVSKYGNSASDKAVTSAFCKILSRNLDGLSSGSMAYYVGSGNNKYLIEWYLNSVDDGADLLATLARHVISDTAAQILDEYGIKYGSNDDASDRLVKTSNYRRAKLALIHAIKKDEFVYVDDTLKRSPELLDDEDVINAINDKENDGSFTARELRKRLSEKPVSKYNF